MSKRGAHGNGTTRQRADGTWESRCYINGKRKSFYGERQKDAIKAMRAAQIAADDGKYFEPVRLTLKTWLTTWLEEYVQQSVKPLTYSTYKSKINTHIIPALGPIKLQSLNPTQIQAFINDLSRVKKLQPKSVKDVFGILHKALEQALKLHYIGLNPCDACTLPRIEKKEVKPLTEEDIQNFIAELHDEPFKDLFTVTLFTGMREGEVCGLSWDDIDLKNGTITVRQQLQRGKEKGSGFYITKTKNSRSRTITAAPFIMDTFNEIKAEQKKNKQLLEEAWNNEWNLVFVYGDGSVIPPQTVLKHYKRIAERIGRPDTVFHTLRHSYAVTALQLGDSLKTVQATLGHATASFTADVYGHVSEKMRQDSAARMQSYYENLKND